MTLKAPLEAKPNYRTFLGASCGKLLQSLGDNTAFTGSVWDDVSGGVKILNEVVQPVLATSMLQTLSTNDYTNSEKTKLAGIAEGAQKNVQPDWALTSGDGSIKNKPTIPTKVSQLTNDSSYAKTSEVDTAITTKLNTLDLNSEDIETVLNGTGDYITELSQENGLVKAKKRGFFESFYTCMETCVNQGDIASQVYVNQKIIDAVGKITSFEYKIVDSLPATTEGKNGVIYLVAHSGSTAQNVYDEYIFLPAEGSTAARYEKIGTTDIDLTPYAKKTDVPTKLSQLTDDMGFINAQTSATHVANAIKKLDYSDTAVTGQYVSSVSETDGVISITRASFADAIPAITETQIDNICTF